MRIQQRRGQIDPVVLIAASVFSTVSFTVALIIGQTLAADPTGAPASRDDSRVRTVQGEIVAVNVEDKPNVIVVRVMLPGKKELIVGATVKPTTAISRGSQQVRLGELKVGERVVLTYMKSSDGLSAHSIQIH